MRAEADYRLLENFISPPRDRCVKSSKSSPNYERNRIRSVTLSPAEPVKPASKLVIVGPQLVDYPSEKRYPRLESA